MFGFFRFDLGASLVLPFRKINWLRTRCLSVFLKFSKAHLANITYKLPKSVLS